MVCNNADVGELRDDWPECIWTLPDKNGIRPECDIRENFDTNECPNIFVSTKLHEWISKYIHINLFYMNECPNKGSYWKFHEYLNIYSNIHQGFTL